MSDVGQNVQRATDGATNRATDERLPLAAPAMSGDTVRTILGESCRRCGDVDLPALRGLLNNARAGMYDRVQIVQLLGQMLGRGPSDAGQ